jgi:hypothetical protein
MPLLMGTWRLFVSGVNVETRLTLSDMGPDGRFKVSSTTLSSKFGQANPFPMSGEGFWNEVGQAVSFSLTGGVAGTVPLTLVFAGHQVPPAVADPAQDQVWTLVGECRHALVAVPPLQPQPVPDESARRSVFGWYAQITQIM